MARRQERIESVLKNLAGSFIKTRAKTLAIIAVSRVEISPDLKLAKIFVNIFPEKKEKQVLEFLKEDEKKFKDYIKSRLKMKFLLQPHFEIDQSAKAERRIEELLK